MEIYYKITLKDFLFWLGDTLFPITNMEIDMKRKNKFIYPFTKKHYYTLRFIQIMEWLLFPVSVITAIVAASEFRFNIFNYFY